jgi:hypothetical protein
MHTPTGLLNYSMFLCTVVNSAVLTTVVGVIKVRASDSAYERGEGEEEGKEGGMDGGRDGGKGGSEGQREEGR